MTTSQSDERAAGAPAAPSASGHEPRFARVPRHRRGYAVGQVDAFLARALGTHLTAEQVRRAGFDLRLGGYDVEAVDAELDRLEDIAAGEERDQARTALGERKFVGDVTSQAQVLRARLARPHGDRFARGSFLAHAYDVEQVDELCDLVAEYFDGSAPLTVDQLRSAVFRTRRGGRGYSEDAVDRFLDRVVAIIGRVGA
ncbi:DivIVA domain-containing protein [Angustibacter aerolatus]